MPGRARTCLLAALLGFASACAIVVDYAKVDPPPGATCGPKSPADCQVLPTPSFGVFYAPLDHKPLRAATRGRAPRSADIVIQWCVQQSGHVADAQIVNDGGAPKLAGELVTQVYAWRSKPAVIDRQWVHACVQALVTVERTHQPARASTSMLGRIRQLSLDDSRPGE